MNHVDTTQTITHVSLCAGYGGIDLGLKRAIPALRTIAFSEIEAFAAANLVAKMEAGLLDAAPLWTDLKTFPWAEFHGCVDILSGGYPCQPFSAAGKRLGADDPRHLWPHISAGIAAMRPAVCFFENVEGHISLGLREVISELESLGYKTTWGIFSASEVGAPHQRKRVFILAECSSQRGAARLSRQIAGQEGVAGVADDGGDLGQLVNAELHGRQDWQHDNTRPQSCSGHSDTWPSRPGEPQHWWEPPRVVSNPSSQRAGQRSELRGEECGSRSALPRDVEQSGEGRLPNTAHLRLEEQSECGAEREAAASGAGNAGRVHPRKAQEGRPLEHSSHRSNGEQQAEQQGRHSAGGSGEEGTMGHPDSPRPQVGPRQRGSAIQGTDTDGGASEQRQIKLAMGDPVDGTEPWLGVPQLSGLSHQELAEIREWMQRSDNRTDELRLLGNGVVPQTCERAFRVLMEELTQ